MMVILKERWEKGVSLAVFVSLCVFSVKRTGSLCCFVLFCFYFVKKRIFEVLVTSTSYCAEWLDMYVVDRQDE